MRSSRNFSNDVTKNHLNESMIFHSTIRTKDPETVSVVFNCKSFQSLTNHIKRAITARTYKQTRCVGSLYHVFTSQLKRLVNVWIEQPILGFIQVIIAIGVRAAASSVSWSRKKKRYVPTQDICRNLINGHQRWRRWRFASASLDDRFSLSLFFLTVPLWRQIHSGRPSTSQKFTIRVRFAHN